MLSTLPGCGRRAGGLAAAALGLSLALGACGGDDAFEPEAGNGDTGTAGSGQSVVIGGATFTDTQILAEMYAALLQDAGYQTELQLVDSREIYAPALQSGEIDIAPEYAATMAEYLNLDENGPDAEPVASSDVDATVEALRGLAEPRGLQVLEPAEAANQNAFVVTEEFAAQNELTTLTDLGESGMDVVLAATEECPDRPFCQPGLQETYGITISDLLPLGFGSPQTLAAVQDGTAQLGLTGTVDGNLATYGLVALEDDQGLQNADNLIPIASADSPIVEDEQAVEALNALSEALTTEDLLELNTQVVGERQQAADVARAYLEEEGLLG